MHLALPWCCSRGPVLDLSHLKTPPARRHDVSPNAYAREMNRRTTRHAPQPETSGTSRRSGVDRHRPCSCVHHRRLNFDWKLRTGCRLLPSALLRAVPGRSGPRTPHMFRTYPRPTSWQRHRSARDDVPPVERELRSVTAQRRSLPPLGHAHRRRLCRARQPPSRRSRVSDPRGAGAPSCSRPRVDRARSPCRHLPATLCMRRQQRSKDVVSGVRAGSREPLRTLGFCERRRPPQPSAETAPAHLANNRGSATGWV